MLVPKDVLLEVETVCGNKFVVGKPPVGKLGFKDPKDKDKTPATIEKYLFEDVKAIDEGRRVDVTCKDLTIDPAKYPAGTAVEFEGLSFGLYADKTGTMHVWLAAQGVRPVLKTA